MLALNAGGFIAAVIAFVAHNPLGAIAACLSITASVYSIVVSHRRNRAMGKADRSAPDENDDLPYEPRERL